MQPQAPNPGGADPRLTSSASWLYWVAAMSAINTVIQLSGGDFQFSLGLGVTVGLTAIGGIAGPTIKVLGLVISAIVIMLLVLFGYMASRGAIWAL